MNNVAIAKAGGHLHRALAAAVISPHLQNAALSDGNGMMMSPVDHREDLSRGNIALAFLIQAPSPHLAHPCERK